MLSFKLGKEFIIQGKFDINVLLIGHEGLVLVLPHVVQDLGLFESRKVVVNDEVREGMWDVRCGDPHTA